MTGVDERLAQPAPGDAARAASAPPPEGEAAPMRARDYADYMIARAKELHERDAFEPAPGMLGMGITAEKAKATTRAKARNAHALVITFVVAIVVIASVSLLLPYYGVDQMAQSTRIFSPGEVLSCYALWFQLHVLPLFDSSAAGNKGLLLTQFKDEHGTMMYSLVMRRATVTAVVVLCGIMLAVSGLIFQTSFRNPIATPSVLGVSDGVTVGVIIFVMLGNTSISVNPRLYVLLTYGCGALAVAVVLGLSRGATGGGRRYNILDMLLLGTVLAQLLGGISSYFQNFYFDENTYALFYMVLQSTNALQYPVVVATTVGVFAVTMVLALVWRFRFNLIAFNNEEGRLMGAHAGALRIGALVLGSVMQLAAITAIGQVAMISLAVPFLVRYMMPGDFRSQLLGNCLVGVTVLLACNAVQYFAIFGFITMPLGTIVSILIIPFFVWMVAFGRGGWS